MHTRSLISAFVVHLLKSSIYKLATGEILIFYLISEAEQTAGLSVTLSEILEDRFSRYEAQL